MKRTKGFSTVAAVVSIFVIAALCFLTFLVIKHDNEAVNFEDYVGTAIVAASEDTGGIAEHVRGSAEAPVIIHEYANFQCSHCALMNPVVEQAVAESNGQLAVVFRNMTWAAMQNSKAAASAAEAAGLQGFWDAYADKLFEEQAEWSYADGAERTDLFKKYFEEVAGEQGDVARFEADMSGEAVAKKISFDLGMANQAGAEATPAFYIDGQLIDLNGGDLSINGKTVHYEAVDTGDDFKKVMQDIIAAKTGA